MKPILLTIEGLHSFREKQVIDFNQLSDAGVFGIFGPTGSGKSTILDGLTLALFGTVGRAKNRTQGILNHAENQLTVSLQFVIGTGTERKTYQIDRRYERTTETTVKNKYSRIYEVNPNQEQLAVLADKDGEVTQCVQEILGLKPDDFARAVVLPQGKFADFLQLGGRERREMLQRLFALERYGMHLTKKLNERHQKTKQTLEIITAEQNGMGDCSKEAVQQAERLYKEAIVKEDQANKSYSEAIAQYEKSKQIVEWQESLKDTLLKLTDHTISEQPIQIYREKIKWHDTAEKIIPFVNQYEAADAEHRSVITARADLEISTEILRSEAEIAKTSYEQALQEHQQQSPGLIKRQAELEGALELEQEIQKLNLKIADLQPQHDLKQQEHLNICNELQQILDQQRMLESELKRQEEILEQNQVTLEYRAAVQLIINKNNEYQTGIKELENKHSDLQRRSQELEIAQKQDQQTRLIYETLSAELAVYEKRKQELQNQTLTDQEQLRNEESSLAECKIKAERLSELEKLLDSDEKLKNELEEQKSVLTASLHEITGNLEESRVELTALRDQYRTEALRNKRMMAVTLAADLITGGECPVCGSLDHPHPVQEDLFDHVVTEMEQVEGRLLDAESTVNQLADQESTVKIEVHIKTEKSKDLQQTQLSRKAEIQALRQQMQEQLTFSIGDKTAVSVLAAIDNQREKVNQKQSEWTEWKKSLESLQEMVQKHKDEVSMYASKLAGYEQQLKAAITEQQAASQSRQQQETIVKTLEVELHTCLDVIGVMNAEQALDNLNSKDTCNAHAKQLEKQLQTRLNVLVHQMTEKQQQQVNLRVDVAELAKSLEETRQILTDKRSKWHYITNGTPSEELHKRTVTELERFHLNEETTRKSYEQKTIQFSDKERQLAEINTRVHELEKRIEKAQQDLNEKLQSANFVTSQAVKDALLLEEELTDYKNLVQIHQDQGAALQNEKNKLESNLNGQEIDHGKWLQIQQELQKAEAFRQQTVSNRSVFKDQYERLCEKHDHWLGLEMKRVKLEKQFVYLDQLKSIFRGERFVEFLAQEQLNFVAAQASDRLKSLTRNRYALEIGEDGGFVMRDDANGGARRPVSSLSGGETFLTSLALALSLSSQIQLKGKYPLEFFFLDEGFGTLDPELLDVVMSTLEQLHLEQMTIGIISHVPELQQRLHRRLLVEPAEAAGRGSRVRIDRM